MSEQKLCVGKSLWGVAEAGDPDKWDDMLTRIKAEGYTLVESILIFDVNKYRALFRQLLDKHGLELVVQVCVSVCLCVTLPLSLPHSRTLSHHFTYLSLAGIAAHSIQLGSLRLLHLL